MSNSPNKSKWDVFSEELAKNVAKYVVPFFVIIFVIILLFVVFGFRVNTDNGVEISIAGIRFTLASPTEIPPELPANTPSRAPTFAHTLTTTPLIPTSTIQLTIPQSQKVEWEPNDSSLGPGLRVNGNDEFVPWVTLKSEFEQEILTQIPRIPNGSTVIMADLGEQQNWLIHVIEADEAIIGDVWIGNNPDTGWDDGLIRIGSPTYEVWATFQRYSDNSYQME